ncbi:ATP-binding protein [Anaerococcus urinomassiliensis]|uniref:ATP-binding protein n=1 Tax=Anaerococcus urinomassiliensis TaxID=1745712 RepID=UPI00093DFE8F|nr:anti-sigma regulatory factor [Anaerococcus urinomassiliensis]
MDKITITIPARKIYLKSIRLFTASLASDLGFNIEEVEDLRVVVSEAINYKLSDEDVKIEFLPEDKNLQIKVIGKDKSLDQRALKMRDLILKELADEVEITSGEIKITKRAS